MQRTFQIHFMVKLPSRTHILSSEIWGKTFTDWFKTCSDGYIFSLWYRPVHIELAAHQIFCVPDVKSKKSLNSILYSVASCSKLP